MDNLVSQYQQCFNLNKAIFLPIEHEEAMVAIVYKIICPNGSSYILKICPRAEDYFREVYFLKLFSKVLPVPHIVQYEPPLADRYGAVLMECLSGNILNNVELTDKLAYKIGSLLACIHLNKAERFGDLTQPQYLSTDPRVPFTSKFEEGFEECRNRLPSVLLEQARRYYDTHIHLLASVDGPCIIHRDFRPGNIIVFNGELTGIIDWASARASFSEDDFCPLELNEWSKNPNRKKSFLKGYASIRPAPDYKLIMPLLRLSRSFATIGFTVKQGTWNTVNGAVYQMNRHYLETFFKSSAF